MKATTLTGSFGGREGRRVGEVDLDQVIHGHLPMKGGREHVDALLHPLAAETLGPEEPCALPVVDELEGHLLPAGII